MPAGNTVAKAQRAKKERRVTRQSDFPSEQTPRLPARLGPSHRSAPSMVVVEADATACGHACNNAMTCWVRVLLDASCARKESAMESTLA